jgi:hypothetical protein
MIVNNGRFFKEAVRLPVKVNLWEKGSCSAVHRHAVRYKTGRKTAESPNHIFSFPNIFKEEELK